MEKIRAKNICEDEYFYGHKACPGCGGSLAVRLALKVIGKGAVSVLPAGCMSAVGFNFPNLAFLNNSMISPFAGAASMAAGVAAGAKALELDQYKAVVIAGDGGTGDIGIQALSGAIDRNDDIIYICYDNEAYMNTGIQSSGLSPYGADTTTSPAGDNIQGKLTGKKNMFEIVAAHGINYAATASIGYINDFLDKVQKAKEIKGTSYIHVMAPCPVGWKSRSDLTIELGRQLVDTGLWPLAEYKNGEFIVNKYIDEFDSVEDYLRLQGRYNHLGEQEIKHIKYNRDLKWENIKDKWRYNNGD